MSEVAPMKRKPPTIVTLQSILNPGRALESASADQAPVLIGPIDQALIINRVNRVLEHMETETAKSSGNVLIAAQDAETSMLQSRVAEDAKAGRPLPGGGLEAKFGEGATGGDLWGWFKSLFDHIDTTQWHTIVAPPEGAQPDRLPDTFRAALLSDWGTGLYGAPTSANSIRSTSGYELLMHLGDIYYSGTADEANERFLGAWPGTAAKISRALNGNHEMYSGGYAYFDQILPKFDQASSYFAMQNAHWLLAALDTSCDDHALDAAQVRWLERLVQGRGPRKVVLFSHHQPFSLLSGQGPKLQAALAGLLQQQAITAWYWGHEHDCVLYGKHARFGLLGRCIGNGGIPSPRKSNVMNAPIESTLAGITWRRFGATADSPSCLVLDGPNPLVPGEETKFSPHGYLTLEFDGPGLTERIHLPDGTEIFRGQVA